MAELPAARQAEYCASKAAVGQLHECLRWELRARPDARHVRSLLVQPYAVRTQMIDGAALLGEGGGAVPPPLRLAWAAAAAAPPGGRRAARRARGGGGGGAGLHPVHRRLGTHDPQPAPRGRAR
eukprot:CAMPEP_0185521010 /NCGR_PEP_ID=MMETSP1366-20130426/78938_1 /TAXON_ID=38817 /ORGANISM="Gephyrocapsa oceanica, Strain RCC1303" /LENGTH=123 /DNA_ID=CAMNT_0028132141 /DNA_START=8 /DNA_END=375 /DNA_ORIENTATION=+